MKNIVLVDIDHTLSDAFHRDPMIGTVSWDEYHAAAHKDDPAHDMGMIIRALMIQRLTVVGLTGRPEKWRDLTVRWLIKHELPLDDLLMRPDDDYRKAGLVKLDLVRKTYGGEWHEKVLCIIDDHEGVIETFRGENITCLQIFNRRKKDD